MSLSFFSRLQAKIEDGEITITRETNDSIDPRKEKDQIQEKITNFLTSVSLVHRKVTFSLIPTGFEIESKGTFYLLAEAGSYSLSGTEVDFIITNKDGQIIAVTKKERMARQQKLFDLINNYGGDPTALKILESYKNALDHNEKLLVYLYEIREALKNHFDNNEEKTIQKLNLDRNQWDKFGKLSNDPSIKQGRHNKEISVNSRDITERERNSALSFAQTMIENFLCYLRQNGNK
jgi:hypothetical protein